MKDSTIGLPGGAALTAAEVCAGARLHGKLAVITGASTGIGLETASALALAGAHVFLGARDEQALMNAKQRIAASSPWAEVSVHRLDLMLESSILAFANAVESLGRPVDILICNSGVMACPLTRTHSGMEAQFMTNYVGHAFLTSRLSRMLRSSRSARFVSLSSSAHHLASVDLDDPSFLRRPYDRWAAYGQSKTAAALLAVQVHQRMAEDGVTGFAVHPGLIKTELARHLNEAERTAIDRRIESAGTTSRWKTTAAGAATTAWAATAAMLNDLGSAYLEDCSVARPICQPNFLHGVMPYARDSGLAQELWRVTEELLGATLPL